MKKITALLTVLALLLFTGCQPVMPITAVPENDMAQTALTATTPITGTNLAQGSGFPGPVHCLIDFEAAVRQGPSSGLALKGVFDFKVNESGVLHGVLLQSDQTEIVTGGQVNGRAIHLIFVVGENKFVFGVGTTLKQIENEDCGVVLGGPFVGPEPGDAGDWLAFGRGASPSSTPSMCDSAGCTR
jgi:hypothetical protein